LIFDDLRAIQDKFGYLPADQLEGLSHKTKIPLPHIHGVASFFPLFHLSPPPKVHARVCMDMSCHLRGADNLRSELKQRFGAMSADDVVIGEVSCLGQCDGAPGMSINDHIFRQVSIPQAEALIFAALGGSELPHLERGPRITGLKADPYQPSERYGVARKLAETKDFAGVIAQLKASGLAGLGGAGFPTGMKWETVRNAPGDEKYVICNADESEPGTIKDRFILEHVPHLVAEGMIIAGLVTGARRGIMYIRHEYHLQEHIFHEEIANAREIGAIGENVFGSGLTFDLEVFVSPGGYIQGEETALIEAIQGNRGEPRNKPPFPVFEGLWHKPTALNNVETFANAPLILAKGVDWYKAQGVGGSAGLKFVGVSGDVNKPGVFLIPMGTPMRDVIYQHCEGMLGGANLKAFAPSGPSSGYLPASLVDTRIDFKPLAAVGSMMGSGAIVVYGEGRCMVDQALNATKFFRNESCGKCVPCRVGSQKMVDLITGWTRGKGTSADMDLIHELMEAMKLGSICGLGQFVHSPIASVMQHFSADLEMHIRDHVCPDRICPMRDPGN
jgi:NADH:ubiquinone oxidoreductase subunit F (NADH-binding)/NADH:ubiquinone oxidoreductase subunit E